MTGEPAGKRSWEVIRGRTSPAVRRRFASTETVASATVSGTAAAVRDGDCPR